MEIKLARDRRRGFTLVELLVVITIIVVLALLSFAGASMFIDRGRKVQALAQFRDLSAGLQAFAIDYQKGPIPKERRDIGADTVYGDPSGAYSNDFVVAALLGDPKQFSYGGSTFDVADVNPRKELYLRLPQAPNKKNGVGLDGILYDPWGNSLMIAINTPPYRTDAADGFYDRLMFTNGVGEYSDSKPREQEFVFWSFGKDGKKGKKAGSKTAVVPLQGTDDVASWQ